MPTVGSFKYMKIKKNQGKNILFNLFVVYNYIIKYYRELLRISQITLFNL